MESAATTRRAMYDKSIIALDEAIAKLDRRRSGFTWFRAQRGLEGVLQSLAT